MYNLKATIKQFLETVESDTPSAFKPILDKYFEAYSSFCRVILNGR